MSTGTMMQLAALGVQNSDLNLSPKRSIWERPRPDQIYPYAIESMESDNFYWERDHTYSYDIPRNGDLARSIQLIFDFEGALPKSFSRYLPGRPSLLNWEQFSKLTLILDQNNFFSFLYPRPPASLKNKDVYDIFEYVVLNIGGNQIEKLTSEHIRFIHRCIENFDDPRSKLHKRGKGMGYVVEIPFGFTSGEGTIPLLPLQFHVARIDVKLKIEHPSLQKRMRVEYVFLDNHNRRLSCNVSERLLCLSSTFYLREDRIIDNPHHPVRYLVFHKNDVIKDRVSLYFNSSVRESWDIYQLQIDNFRRSNLAPSDEYCLISFAVDLRTPDHTGSCNFGRIDQIRLEGVREGAQIFASHYNTGRFHSGMFAMKFTE